MKDNNHLPTKVIIHVGRHKTGTTSIQSFLALNEDILASEYGIYYPRVGRDPRFPYHHPLFKPIVDFNRPVRKEQVDEIIKDASDHKCHTVLLSSEMLSRSGLSDHQLSLIRDSFSGLQIKIILYFRRQDFFIESRYSEQVKRGLLAAPQTISNVERTSLDYYQFAMRYEAVFGKEALIVRSFDRDKAKGLLKCFLSVINIPLSNTFEVPQRTLNTRYPWRYIELIRRFNRLKWGRSVAMNKYIRLLATKLTDWFPGFMDQPRPLTPQQRDEILVNYQNSNEQLANRYLNEKSLF